MNPVIEEFKILTQKTASHLKEDLKSIRTGRANPSLVEGVVVETYGGQTKLKLMELATIINEDAMILSITPYDPSTIQDIEKAILKSPLGLNPQVQGTKITLRIPPLSEEQRNKMTKLIHQMVEEKKTAVRNFRDDMRRKIKHMFEAKTLTEDQKFRFEKEIDTQTQEVMESIKTIKEHKDSEIMEV